MLTPVALISLILLGFESLVSNLGNGFIIVVIFSNWIKSRKLASCEHILISLSISRFLLQWLVMLSNFIYVSFPTTSALGCKHKAFGILWAYLNLVSLWCATCLSFFYSVKITNFTQPLFLWLKLRIAWLVPRLLLGSLIVSLVSTMPLIWSDIGFDLCNSTKSLERNTTWNDAKDIPYIFFVPVQILVLVIPFIIFLVSSTLLLISLWKHTKKMKNNVTRFKDLSVEAHIGAMKSLLSFFILYIMYFVTVMVLLTSIIKFQHPVRLPYEVLLSAYPSGHPVILILTNPKLKQVAVKILHQIKCQLREGTL
ncbi:taste receptor type 2 member 7-like [Pelodiscus sinensis]|uniref:taste receptor type 2 member 7-like n=1 Tax=Pelodiscus sinensis TaxID=13735 RepID=UPI000D72226F|nr:taste receptor type 2 member 7-like [Pelodiscus sinensis]|eukprot:XP_025040250.1 taste receptor type 2 member 7-like [Pelodiscus sinensis]